ncbi:MAG: MFS transporter [archaeon]|nr:MFS transporter [archaeon]
MHKMESSKYISIVKKTWPLLLYQFAVSQFVSSEFINLLYISNLIWPNDGFHSLEMGAMISVRLWFDGGFALLWGYLADRFSRKKLISITASISGFFIILNGLIPIGGGFNSYLFWLANHALIGFSMSGGNPNINSLTSDLLDKREKSQYFGLASLVFNGTRIFSMIISAIFFQLGFWRLYFGYCGFTFLILSIWFIFKFKEPKRGIQEKTLRNVIKDTEVEYDYILTKKTIRSTIFSKTNILIFGEGIFSGIFFGVLDLLLLPYIQSPPRNISAANSSIFMLIFGVPGALLGTAIFAKLSDKYGSEKLKSRISLIIFALVTAFSLIFILFMLPLPNLTVQQGNDFSIITVYPVFMLLGLIVTFSGFVTSIYAVNQPPIIQEINLPEAQGTIASWNQLVEIVSYGSGPIIAGYFLQTLNNNYFGAITIIICVGFPGVLMWILTYWTIDRDRKRIQSILRKRAEELKNKKVQIKEI